MNFVQSKLLIVIQCQSSSITFNIFYRIQQSLMISVCTISHDGHGDGSKHEPKDKGAHGQLGLLQPEWVASGWTFPGQGHRNHCSFSQNQAKKPSHES